MLEKEKVLDDIARLAGGTVSALNGLRTQLKGDLRARIDEMALKLDLVPREEFERLETLLIATREQQQKLEARVAALENSLGKKTAAKSPAKPKAKTKKSK
jgi:BMFP domain-containing protein YqiC